MSARPSAARFWSFTGALAVIVGSGWGFFFAAKDPGFFGRFGLALTLAALYAASPLLLIGDMVADSHFERGTPPRYRLVTAAVAVPVCSALIYVAGSGVAWPRLPTEFDLRFAASAACFLVAALGGMFNALFLERVASPPIPAPPRAVDRGPFRTPAVVPEPEPERIPAPAPKVRPASFWWGVPMAVVMSLYPGTRGMALLTYLTLLAVWEGRDRGGPPYPCQAVWRLILAANSALVVLAVVIRP